MGIFYIPIAIFIITTIISVVVGEREKCILNGTKYCIVSFVILLFMCLISTSFAEVYEPKEIGRYNIEEIDDNIYLEEYDVGDKYYIVKFEGKEERLNYINIKYDNNIENPVLIKGEVEYDEFTAFLIGTKHHRYTYDVTIKDGNMMHINIDKFEG